MYYNSQQCPAFDALGIPLDNDQLSLKSYAQLTCTAKSAYIPGKFEYLAQTQLYISISATLLTHAE